MEGASEPPQLVPPPTEQLPSARVEALSGDAIADSSPLVVAADATGALAKDDPIEPTEREVKGAVATDAKGETAEKEPPVDIAMEATDTGNKRAHEVSEPADAPPAKRIALEKDDSAVPGQTTDEAVGDSSEDVEMDEEEALRSEEEKRTHEEFIRTLETKQHVDVYDVRTKAWLAAKIERLSDEGYTVHYMGWNAKCDEKISKTSSYRIQPRATRAIEAWEKHQAKIDKHRLGAQKKLEAAQSVDENVERLKGEEQELIPTFVQTGLTRSGRAITRRIENGALKKPKAPVKKKTDAMESKFPEEDLCGVCGEIEDDDLTDMMLCDGGCLKSYHFSCLGIDTAPDGEEWLCEQCRTNEQLCFGCGRNGTINEKGGVLHLPWMFLPKRDPDASNPADCHHFRLWKSIIEDVRLQPPTYRKLGRSIYTFKQPKISLEDDPVCVCKEICGDDCINRLSFTECFGPAPTPGMKFNKHTRESNCTLGENCGNRALHQKVYPRFQKFHTVEKGWALRVLEHVKAGQLVIEYVGEVINEEEKERRLLDHAKNSPDDKNMYIMELGKGEYIDARFKGSVSRFINHSCDPNCHLLKWRVKGVNRIAITALKDIEPGTELSYDYQFHTKQAMEWKCHCNSKNCRGTMAPEKINQGNDSPVKRLTKKEQVKQRKRAIMQEKIQHDKEVKSTARRLSLTSQVSMGDRTTIDKMVVRTGPATRELQWARHYRLFNVRNAKHGFNFKLRKDLRDSRSTTSHREQLSVSGSTTAASSRSVSPDRLSGDNNESTRGEDQEVLKNSTSDQVEHIVNEPAVDQLMPAVDATKDDSKQPVPVATTVEVPPDQPVSVVQP
ncbi:Histone-lysine N-methyltransferase [Phytophthora megakarya]|uniref:Histone-lysine N-methyltransferase n=1 Tax=Phytophthora megakarya TaxID=4795 RepID=A0A225WZJ8_9STRA|nr:Histone-lysine N-methyltransferase [Phytophthora megakarya]